MFGGGERGRGGGGQKDRKTRRRIIQTRHGGVLIDSYCCRVEEVPFVGVVYALFSLGWQGPSSACLVTARPLYEFVSPQSGAAAPPPPPRSRILHKVVVGYGLDSWGC